MGIRGPKSAEDLVTPTVADLRGDERPKPPPGLTEEQAAEWRAVVDRLPADWFARENHGLLAQYCRHVTTIRRLARMVEQMGAPEDLLAQQAVAIISCVRKCEHTEHAITLIKAGFLSGEIAQRMKGGGQ